jgi:cobalt-zinc-cadmium efflux system membrane fusion protein
MIHPETKTINCIAKITKETDFNFINRSFIEAKIFLDQTEAKALPSNALLKSDQQYFVLVHEKTDDLYYYLRKVKVSTGRISNGFTEIIDGEKLSKVVVQGVYNLNIE